VTPDHRLLLILTERAGAEGLADLRALVEELVTLRARLAHRPEPGDCCASVRLHLARAREDAARSKAEAEASRQAYTCLRAADDTIDASKVAALAALREDATVLQRRLDEERARSVRAEEALAAAQVRAFRWQAECSRLREQVAQTRAEFVREFLAREVTP